MSEVRLQAHFSKIHDHFNGKNSDTTLFDIAAIFCCTPRNARILLNKMTRQRWLTWQPSVGRGKRSRLLFHCSESDLQIKRIRHCLKMGNLDTALKELNNDGAKLTKLIQNQFGISKENGKQIIRFPSSRPFPYLHPARPLQGPEQYLVSLIFNGLTRINETTGCIEADLAHHWEAITEKHWRFYLRPCIRFHDGNLLHVDDVIYSIRALKNNTYFSHIEHIQSPENNVVDFYLRQADCQFDYTLSFYMASICSKKNAESKHAERLLVGTGPYLVTQNNDTHLVLKAHDSYFGFRALTDQIEIWILNIATMPYWQPFTSKPIELVRHQSEFGAGQNKRLKLDEGCNYLLLNRNNGIAKDPAWANYLSYQLSSLRLLAHLAPKEIAAYRLINAYGLLPGWSHVNANSQNIIAPSKTTLRLVHQTDNPLLSLIAKALQTALQIEGIELVVDVISYEEMMQPKQTKKIDIWLCEMNMENKRSDAILAWIMNFEHFPAAMPRNEFAEIKEKMEQWREAKNGDFEAQALGRGLVESAQIIPLFHAWLCAGDGCNFEQRAFNHFESIDLKSLWKKPLLFP